MRFRSLGPLGAALMLGATASSPITFEGDAELVLRGVVSTSATEVRPSLAPNGEVTINHSVSTI